MPKKSKKVKKTTKKTSGHKAPKPSVLLKQALDLFGPNGEFWITGDEHQHRDERYVFDGIEYDDLDEAREAIADSFNVSDHIKVNGGIDLSSLIAEAKRVEKESFEVLPEADLFCSIGALYEVNTPNQKVAVSYLAQAISDDYRKAINIKHNPKTDAFGPDCKCAECQGIDSAVDIITMNNDDLHEETGFKTVRKWFQKAIKLAQQAGQ